MRRTQIVPIDSPREFLHNELFFSMTNEKGLISSTNPVFDRVSGYSPKELHGSAHNIIRHPDMPRAVFKLFWEQLQSGNNVAAYVKNMASDGRYYWVLAIAGPLSGGGFLSIRFLPSSTLHGEIGSLYRKLRETELAAEAAGDWRSGMANAYEELAVAIRARGFSSYNNFMQHALHVELAARKEALERDGISVLEMHPGNGGKVSRLCEVLRETCDKARKNFMTIWAMQNEIGESASSMEALPQYADSVIRLGREFQLIATNITIKAARLSDAGGGLGVIAQRMHEATSQVMEVVSMLKERATATARQLGEALFEMEWAGLQLEMVITRYAESLSEVSARASDDRTPPNWHQDDITRLRQAFDESAIRTINLLGSYGHVLRGVSRDADTLDSIILTVEMIHIRGAIEAHGLDDDGGCGEAFESMRGQIASFRSELIRFGDDMRDLRRLASRTPEIAQRFQEAVYLLRDAELQVAAEAETVAATAMAAAA